MAEIPNDNDRSWEQEPYPGQPLYPDQWIYTGQSPYPTQPKYPDQGWQQAPAQQEIGQQYPGQPESPSQYQYPDQPQYPGQPAHYGEPEQERQPPVTAQSYYPGQPSYPGQPQYAGQPQPNQTPNQQYNQQFNQDPYHLNTEQPYGYQYYGASYPPYGQSSFQNDEAGDTTDVSNTASTVLGVLSLIGGIIGLIVAPFYPGFAFAIGLGITAVVLAIIALARISQLKSGGRTLPIVGIVLGSLAIISGFYVAYQPYLVVREFQEAIQESPTDDMDTAPGNQTGESDNSAIDKPNNQKKESDQKSSESQATPNDNNNIYSLGESFTFDGLEFTFDPDYSFVVLENPYSDKNGITVIRLGANIKNISDEKNRLNLFYYDVFGSQGQELESVSSYFDESADFAGELKPGASYHKFFYIPYDGNGKYSIDFSKASEEVSVEFDIEQ